MQLKFEIDFFMGFTVDTQVGQKYVEFWCHSFNVLFKLRHTVLYTLK
jgi:hypothetical protein